MNYEEIESGKFFNSERINRKKNEIELEKRRSTALENAISMNVSEVFDSIEFPSNKEEMITNLEKGIEDIEIIMKRLKEKIKILAGNLMDEQNKKLISSENFAFLKNYLHEKGLIKNELAKNLEELFFELRKN